MKPVLTPVRHTARRKHKSLDSSSGQLSVRIPTNCDASIDPHSIKLHQCVIDGILSLASVQEKHSQLAAQVPCAPDHPPNCNMHALAQLGCIGQSMMSNEGMLLTVRCCSLPSQAVLRWMCSFLCIPRHSDDLTEPFFVCSDQDRDVTSTEDALAWLLRTARTFAHAPRPEAGAKHHAPPMPATEKYYHSMLLRANVLTSKLPLHTDGVAFTAAIAEESDSDDDEFEAVVEPLRTRGAQAIVGATIQKPGKLTKEEQDMVGIDLWYPEDTEAKYKQRQIQEIHLTEAWRSLLPQHALHNTRGEPLTEEDVRCVPQEWCSRCWASWCYARMQFCCPWSKCWTDTCQREHTRAAHLLMFQVAALRTSSSQLAGVAQHGGVDAGVVRCQHPNVRV